MQTPFRTSFILEGKVRLTKLSLYAISLISMLLSCSKYPAGVEESLRLSEENREELEKVLEYFKTKGGIPYQSACFLIENMKYHKSVNEILLDPLYADYFMKTDSTYTLLFSGMDINEVKKYKKSEQDSLRIQMADIFNKIAKPEVRQPLYADLRTIDADFLIDNIESALEAWNNKYANSMDFDFFKEFILPYRTTDENLDLKRSHIRRMYEKILAEPSFTAIEEPLEWYKVYVDKCRWLNKYIKAEEHLGIYDLFIPKFKMDCHNMTNWSCNILRACDIPAVYEFTPKWKERDNKHFWCVSPDSSGILQPYTAPDNNLREDWESDIKYAGKVYRRTFGAQKETPYFMANKGEYIPSPLKTPLLSDQTFRYHQTITLRIPLETVPRNNLAYLCMGTRGDLMPVGWGEIDHKRKEAVFRQVPLNTLFFPVYYDDEEQKEIAEPFMIYASEVVSSIPQPLTMNQQPKQVKEISVAEGKLLVSGTHNKEAEGLRYVTLQCDTSKPVDLRLLRKYPEKRRMKEFQKKIKGSCFLAGNQENGNFDTLAVFNYVPYPYLQEMSLNNNKKYRYYRFVNPSGDPVNIAHMEFLGNFSPGHECVSPTPLPIFSDTEKNSRQPEKLYRINGVPLRTGSSPHHAFDNDYNTYVGASSIGMDFTVPVRLTHVRFIPRNANNMIVPGNQYSLYYFNKKWIHFKTVCAEDNYLDFSHVPSGTLYWLKNLTEGQEESPFFYINGKQYFLHTCTLPRHF